MPDGLEAMVGRGYRPINPFVRIAWAAARGVVCNLSVEECRDMAADSYVSAVATASVDKEYVDVRHIVLSAGGRVNMGDARRNGVAVGRWQPPRDGGRKGYRGRTRMMGEGLWHEFDSKHELRSWFTQLMRDGVFDES